MRRIAVLAAFTVVVGCLSDGVAPSSAKAPRATPIWLGVEEPLLLGSAPAQQELIARRIRDSGARYVRISLSLLNLATRKPRDPQDIYDPAYRQSLGTLDMAVRAAVRNGLEPILMAEGTPRWAESPGRAAALKRCPKRRKIRGRWVLPGCMERDFPSAWYPDLQVIRYIGSVLARRYDGNHNNHLTKDLLPRVTYFQAWNEPNLSPHLLPQRARGRLVAAKLYKNLVTAFSQGVKSGGRSYAQVVSAGLGPIGIKGSTAPQEFMLDMLCLKRKGRKLVKLSGCQRPAEFDVWSQHPYDIAGKPSRPRNAKIGNGRLADLPTIRAILDTAISRKTAKTGGRRSLWVTEFDWWTNPPGGPHRLGQKPALVARWTTESIWRMWAAGVSNMIWFHLRDDNVNWPGGLWFASPTICPRRKRCPRVLQPVNLTSTMLKRDRPKPVLASFRWPFKVIPGRAPYAWGVVPCRKSGQSVTIYRRNGRKWVRMARARTAVSGVFTASVGARGAGLWRAATSASCSRQYRTSPEWNGAWR